MYRQKWPHRLSLESIADEQPFNIHSIIIEHLQIEMRNNDIFFKKKKKKQPAMKHILRLRKSCTKFILCGLLLQQTLLR